MNERDGSQVKSHGWGMPRIEVEVERAILGSILIDGSVFKQTVDLRLEDFFLDAHRRIFARLIDLDANGLPTDILTLHEALSRHEELEPIGGVAYIASLMQGVPERPSILHYVKMMREAADRRRAAKIVDNARRLAEDPSVSTTALAEMGNELAELAPGIEPLPPRFSEEGLALRFTRRYADDLRYVFPWGHWMCWDGLRWVDDDTLHVFDLARGICRAASTECGDAKERAAIRIAAAQTVTAIERLARADRRHAARVEQWDSHLWLLNTPAGTIDLRSGEMHKHSRNEYLTKITAAGPSGECPLWLRFLERVTGGDSDLQSFLQRMIGYSLTGSTREHALFFLYGTGANGKSVFLSTVSGLLAEYAKTAPASSFTASSNEQHPTDLAGLRGARFVTAIETEDGTRWAESKIKSLTGGDKIAARFMRQDFFEFVPEFKLIIAGNHKPGLRSVDEAIRRRFHLVPFTVTIPPGKRDSHLAEKLSAEFPGILAWALRGCLEWQQQGLNPPGAVLDATADYMAGEDAIGRWLEDGCISDETLWTSGASLFQAYKAWCERSGEKAASPKGLTQALEGRGLVQRRTSAARGFDGIGLRRGMTHVTDGPVIPVTGARERPI